MVRVRCCGKISTQERGGEKVLHCSLCDGFFHRSCLRLGCLDFPRDSFTCADCKLHYPRCRRVMRTRTMLQQVRRLHLDAQLQQQRQSAAAAPRLDLGLVMQQQEQQGQGAQPPEPESPTNSSCSASSCATGAGAGLAQLLRGEEVDEALESMPARCALSAQCSLMLTIA